MSAFSGVLGRGQVVGDAQLPTPAARYSWSRDEPVPAVHVGEGSLHLNIAQARRPFIAA